MASKAELVDQVKGLQRSDPDSKQAWWTYCDQYLGGVKDPNRHEASTLSEFMTFYNGGGAKSAGASSKGGGAKGPPQAGIWGGGGDAWSGWGGAGAAAAVAAAASAWAGGWGGKGGGPVGSGVSGPSMGEFIKSGQRASVHWKNAWQTYCSLYGNGMNDPMKYDDPHITGFIDYVGQLAYADLQAVAEEQGVQLDGNAGVKRPASLVMQPPAKRPAIGVGVGGGAGVWGAAPADIDTASDPAKMALVEKIKALQRSNPEAKTAWWSYCDDSYKGIKDPNRHDMESLEAFLATHGVV